MLIIYLKGSAYSFKNYLLIIGCYPAPTVINFFNYLNGRI